MSRASESFRCQCDNPDCVLRQKGIVGEGEWTEEAHNHFIGKSLRYQITERAA
jgi:hypothetical protein